MDAEGQLILSAIRRTTAPRVAIRNPGHFMWRVSEHGLGGLLSESMEAPDDAPNASLTTLRPQIKALSTAQEAFIRGRLTVAREIATRLEKSSIPAVFFKGAALATASYSRFGLRPFGDLDLLVARKDVPAALDALSDLGFESSPSAPPSTMEIMLEREGDDIPTPVDLHWRLVESDGLQSPVRISAEEVVPRGRRQNGLPVPAPEDSLLLAASNLVRSRVDRLILVADFDQLARGNPDWDVVRNRASEWRLKTALWLGLDLACRLLGTPVPDEVKLGLAPPEWQARLIRESLSGSALWTRRKTRTRFVCYGLPILALDTPADMIRAIVAVRKRFFRKLRMA